MKPRGMTLEEAAKLVRAGETRHVVLRQRDGSTEMVCLRAPVLGGPCMFGLVEEAERLAVELRQRNPARRVLVASTIDLADPAWRAAHGL